MREAKKVITLEEGILLLQEESKKGSISLGTILRILSGRGRALILILLSLPFCQPLQIPGLSIPFGLAISFVGLRIAFGKHIWLPKKVLEKTLTQKMLQKITDKALILVKKIKRWVHPRLKWLCHLSAMKKVNSLAIFLLGICLALPLPVPFTNLTAAWAIFSLSLGILEDDGVLILVGYFFALLTVVLIALIAFSIEKMIH